MLLILAAAISQSVAGEDRARAENTGRFSEDDRPIVAGVYCGQGASELCVIETVEALRIDPGIKVLTVDPKEIVSGILDGIDVIVFPGGSGSRQSNSIGPLSHDRIREFVISRGKGAVGICAGGYLLSDSKGYPSLSLIGADTVDREHDKRGSALVRVSFTGEGLSVFPEMCGSRSGFIQYHDGPLFVVSPESDAGKFTTLAVNESDVHHTGGAPSGITAGKAFLICAESGKGRVFACAGHPESTPGMRWIVPRMARWAARRELIPYSPDVVRVSLNDREIMHDDEVEMELFWKLFAGSPRARIDALGSLVEKRYRNGIRWAVGMLRDRSPEVRALAAKTLAEEEYTAATGDIRLAIDSENDLTTRKELESALERLEKMVDH